LTYNFFNPHHILAILPLSVLSLYIYSTFQGNPSEFPSEMSAVTSAAGGLNHGGFTAAETMVVPSAVNLPVPVSCSGSNSCARGGPVTGAPVSSMVDNIALPPSSKSVIDSTSNQTTFAQDTIVTAGHLSSKSTPQVSLPLGSPWAKSVKICHRFNVKSNYICINKSFVMEAFLYFV
jgi:hypothetical protein